MKLKKLTFLLFFLLNIISLNSLFSQFVYTGGPQIAGSINVLLISGNSLFAGTSSDGVQVTTNNGDNWAAANNGLTAMNVKAMAVAGSNLFAGTTAGLFVSSNNGASWTQVGFSPSVSISALYSVGNVLYLGAPNGSVHSTTNSGANWINHGYASSTAINAITLFDGTLYAGSSYVSFSTDNGVSWGYDFIPGASIVKCFYSLGSVLRTGTSTGGFKKTTSGGNFVRELPWSNYILAYASAGDYIMQGGSTGIFWSNNNGANWYDPNSMFMGGAYILSMAQNSNYIFAASGGTVYRRPISEFVGISTISTNVPVDYSLAQNYPNPFNPSTNIEFAIPKAGNVSLKIYDQLGRETALLYSGNLAAGTFRYEFDASSYSSGIYYYNLSAGDFSQTKKMVLVK
jgi:hypothetical protein